MTATLEAAGTLAHPDLRAFDAAMDRRYGQVFTDETARELGALAQFAYEAAPDALDAARMRNRNIIGRVALGGEVQIAPVHGSERMTNIATLTERAGQGDRLAEKELTANATAEVTEMLIKSGGVMKAKAYVGPRHEIVQFGKTTTERQENTLRMFTSQLPALRDMTYAEGQNGLAFEEMHKLGLTRGKRMIEFSLIPNASRAELADSGLFLREAIGIIRTTEVKDNGEVEFTSYLVGGTDQDKLPPFREGMTKREEEAIEEQALANRFDIDVVRHMYMQMGVPNAQFMTPAELLATPIVVPDSVDGIDFAMFYDATVKKMTGKNVMMGLTGLHRKTASGQPLTRFDYEAQAQKSLNLQKELPNIGQEVRKELVARRGEAGFDPYKTGRLMHKIAESRSVAFIGDRADEYDLSVFGAETFGALLARQRLLDEGDVDRANAALVQAQQAARGTGCPGGGRNSLNGKVNTSLDDRFDQYGSLKFECPNGHVNERDPGEFKTTPCDTCGCSVEC